MFSMAIVGPFVAAGVFRLARSLRQCGGQRFLATSLADLLTYVTTSAQLAWAFPDPTGGVAVSFAKFASIFAITQIPLAISEGLLGTGVQRAGAFQRAGAAQPEFGQQMEVRT